MKVEINKEEIVVSIMLILIFAFFIFIYINTGIIANEQGGIITKTCFVATIFMGFLSLILWLSFGGKNSKIQIDYNVEFHPPKDINSAKIGYLYHKAKEVNKDTIISLILYLADKGYIKINGKLVKKENLILDMENKIQELKEQKKELLKKKNIILALKVEETIKIYEKNKINYIKPTTHSKRENIYLTKVKEYDGFDSLEAVVFKELFKDKKKVKILEIYDLDQIIEKAKILLKKAYRKTIYDENSIKSKFLNSIMSIASVLIFIIGCLVKDMQMGDITTLIYIIAFISVAFITFSNLVMLKNTEYGERQINKIKLFREFILTVEKDAIKILLKNHPSYYYEILPYAYILGVSDEWINKFNKIKIEEKYTGTYDLKSQKSFDNLVYSFIENAQNN